MVPGPLPWLDRVRKPDAGENHRLGLDEAVQAILDGLL
jgi:hypothetical protein